MTPNLYLKALEWFWQAGVPHIVWGPTGVGKSAIQKQFIERKQRETAKKHGKKGPSVSSVDLRLATQEPADIIGNPYVDPRTEQTFWGRPSWWPSDPNSQGAIRLEEVNRAQKDTVQAVFQLVSDNRLHTHTLPEGWHGRFFGACNPPQDTYVVETLGKAFRARFAHVELEVDDKQWLDNCGPFIEEDLLGFVASRPSVLQSPEKAFDPTEMAVNSGRAVEMLSKIYAVVKNQMTPDNRELLREIAGGIIGTAYAADFIGSLERTWTCLRDIAEGKVEYTDVAADVSDLNRLALLFPVQLKFDLFSDKNGELDIEKGQRIWMFVRMMFEDGRGDMGTAMLNRTRKQCQDHRARELITDYMFTDTLISEMMEAQERVREGTR